MFEAIRRLGSDRIAMTLSGLCLVHCIAGAVLFSTFAILGDVLVSPVIHEVGLALAIPLAVWALGRGFLRHRRLLPLGMGGLGVMMMAIGVSVAHGDPREIAMTVLGVTLVASAHYLNRRAVAG